MARKPIKPKKKEETFLTESERRSKASGAGSKKLSTEKTGGSASKSAIRKANTSKNRSDKPVRSGKTAPGAQRGNSAKRVRGARKKSSNGMVPMLSALLGLLALIVGVAVYFMDSDSGDANVQETNISSENSTDASKSTDKKNDRMAKYAADGYVPSFDYDDVEADSSGVHYKTYNSVEDAPQGAELWKEKGTGLFLDINTVPKNFRSRIEKTGRYTKVK